MTPSPSTIRRNEAAKSSCCGAPPKKLEGYKDAFGDWISICSNCHNPCTLSDAGGHVSPQETTAINPVEPLSSVQRNDAVKARIVECVNNANNPNHYIAHDGKLWLDDVLVAKNAKIDADFSKWNEDEYKPPYGTVGDIKKGLKKKYDEKLLGMWTLGASIDDQPQETKDFLYSILCSND